MNKSDPMTLNDFPYNLIVYNAQIFSPSVYYVVLSILFLSKNESLRKFAWRVLNELIRKFAFQMSFESNKTNPISYP